MLLKLGVDYSRASKEIRFALWTAERIYQDIAHEELVLTSTYEGNHSVRSFHYANQAADVRLAAKIFYRKEILKQLKRELGDDYDVVQERTHNHIEYDPK